MSNEKESPIADEQELMTMDGYGVNFCTTTSFRHSWVLERALENAAKDKRVSKSFVIMACLLGKYNLKRYIDGFNEEDLDFIHAKNLECLRKRNTLKAVVAAKDEDEDFDRIAKRRMRK